MKKICFVLSIAGHGLAILLFMSADFPIKLFHRPPRVIDIEISAPLPVFVETGTAAGPGRKQSSQFATRSEASGKEAGPAPASANAARPVKGSNGLQFPDRAKFSLQQASPEGFTLSPAGRGLKFPVGPAMPVGPPRLGKYSAAAFNPGLTRDGNAMPGVVTLVPFDIKEKKIAAWTETVLARIERNWIISPLARLAFSGQVQVTLTIEKNGRQRALVMDESSLPEPLAQSALQAVRASLPLPPLPENVAGQTFAFAFVFVYNG